MNRSVLIIVEVGMASILIGTLWWLSYTNLDTGLKVHPPRIEVVLSDDERGQLSTEELKLVTKLESGQLSGARASLFRRELQTADYISDSSTGRTTSFKFLLHKHVNRGPGVPIWLDIVVDNKANRIILCDLTSPEW